MRQGDIYYVDFPESVGSVQKGIRPVVITQNNHLNRNSTTYG
ncbi:MAG: type II toxin-antitoxin system PemK/MazF family toxin [Emergencia sp.]